jgi:CelD/BcsL family acetyltransferase involved in cellulose biosynthesis
MRPSPYHSGHPRFVSVVFRRVLRQSSCPRTPERHASGRMSEVPGLVEVSTDPGERPACRIPGHGARPGVKKKKKKKKRKKERIHAYDLERVGSLLATTLIV